MTRFAQRGEASFIAEETDEKKKDANVFFYYDYQGGKWLESHLKNDKNGTKYIAVESV